MYFSFMICLPLLFMVFSTSYLSPCLACNYDSTRTTTTNYHLPYYNTPSHHHQSGQLPPHNHHYNNYGVLIRRGRGSNSRINPTGGTVINVDDFGAKADGRDDSQAFQNAWRKACSTRNGVLVVPKNKIYYLKPAVFSGPCQSYLTLKIYGKIKATSNPSDYAKDRKHWLVFHGVDNLSVGGGGIFDGNGNTWWQNSCKVNKNHPCTDIPHAVTFYECNNLMVNSLWFQNAQKMHLVLQKSVNVIATNLLVTAPADSPNTDGIHVTESQNVQISNSVIRTGDDCISIVSGSSNVRASYITCGPGHGISIGSLGEGNSAAYVSDVMVNKATLFGTTNGVRIKTWQGGSGYAKNIKFQNLVMHNVSNPIIIDQNYCDRDKACKEQRSAVQVSNVLYQNIKGTSATEVAIKYDCSRSFPCRQIFMQQVSLGQAEDEVAKASCSNVRPTYIGNVAPHCGA